MEDRILPGVLKPMHVVFLECHTPSLGSKDLAVEQRHEMQFYISW